LFRVKRRRISSGSPVPNRRAVASTEPKGGVYYVSPDFGRITPVLPHLAMANGIALSPDGKELWVTEFSRNLLHRVALADATTIAPFGTAVAYHFTGPAPDSMRADSDGNLYVAMYGQAGYSSSTRTGYPSAKSSCPDVMKAITFDLPAWPSSQAPTISASSRTMPMEEKARRSSMQRPSPRLCRSTPINERELSSELTTGMVLETRHAGIMIRTMSAA
jgi:sugar lactone lactonase YvrE